MFEGFGGALVTIAEPHVLLTLFFGSVIGLIFGAVPGLGGILAMSMLLPFTFTWDAITAVYLFSGIMGASSFGGSISAILLNTPGTPVNAATCFDGYPMAKRGEAARALGLSAGACLLGALFGLVILALLIQVMRPLVIAFGHPEIFWLVVFGLVTTATVSQGSLLNGLIAGGVGILLSLVGLNEPTGPHPLHHGERVSVGRHSPDPVLRRAIRHRRVDQLLGPGRHHRQGQHPGQHPGRVAGSDGELPLRRLPAAQLVHRHAGGDHSRGGRRDRQPDRLHGGRAVVQGPGPPSAPAAPRGSSPAKRPTTPRTAERC